MKSKWKEKRAERKFITSKLNNSSRTKTVRRNRKKHKKSLSIDKVRSKVTKLLEAGELVLPRVFDDQNIEAMLAEDPTKKDFKSRKRAYTVPVTIGLFMHQVLAKDLGCKSAVTLFNQQREKQGLEPVSTNTTSYCEARARIPLSLLETLVTRSARSAIEKTRARDLWSGRRVFLLDGFVVSAPDKQIVLKKPRFSTDRFTPIEWKELPATLKVRMIRYRIPGVRREEFTIITTLLDPKTYPARKIADLYK